MGMHVTREEVARMSLQDLDNFLKRNRVSVWNIAGGVLQYQIAGDSTTQVLLTGEESGHPQVVDLATQAINEILEANI